MKSGMNMQLCVFFLSFLPWKFNLLLVDAGAYEFCCELFL